VVRAGLAVTMTRPAFLYVDDPCIGQLLPTAWADRHGPGSITETC